MNKCLVHKKKCKHATTFGVCLLSNKYDCKPIEQEENQQNVKVSTTNKIKKEHFSERIKQGMEEAKKRGVRLGRPKCKLPDKFTEICERWIANEFTDSEIAKQLGIHRVTFLDYAHKLGYKKGYQYAHINCLKNKGKNYRKK